MARSQVTATWLAPSSGSWTQPTRWSTNTVPNNDPTTSYNVLINPAGSYTVFAELLTLNLDGFTLNSSNASLLLSGSVLTTPNGSIPAGTVRGGTLAGSYSTTFASLENMSLAGSLSVAAGGWTTLDTVNATSGSVDVPAGATLSIAGSHTTSAIAAMNITRDPNSSLWLQGGSIGGTLDNTGSTINVDSGLFRNVTFGGIKVRGGTITGTTGTAYLRGVPTPIRDASTFDGVIVSGKLDLQAFLQVANNLTLSNATLLAAGSISFEPNGTLAGTGSFSRGDIYGPNLTIGPGINIAITTTNSYIGAPTMALTNRGTLRNDGPLPILTVSATTGTNLGLIAATNGGDLRFQGTWSNQGTISMNGGNIELDNALINNSGTFTATNASFTILHRVYSPAELAALPLAGNSTLLYYGSGINAAGGTYNIPSAGGNIRLEGASLYSGRFTSDPGRRFDVTNSFPGLYFNPTLLSNATLAAPMNVAQGGLVRAVAGAALDGTDITLNSTNSNVANQTFLQILGGTTLGGTGTITFNGTQNNGTVEGFTGTGNIGPGITIQTGNAGGRVGDSDRIDSLINLGTIWSKTSGKTISITGNSFTNTGALRASGGGIVSVLGTTNFTNVAAGTLTGGTYRVGSSSIIDFGGRTFTTNAADILLEGAGSNFTAAGPINNNTGTFAITDGRNFTTQGNLANAGTLRVGKDSTLTVNGTLTSTGKIKGKGVIRGSVISSGNINPGESPGFLTIDGSLNSSGVLEIELAGPDPITGYDVLNVTGPASFTGTLRLLLLDGYVPGEFDSLTFVSSPNLLLNFSNFDLPPLPGNMQWNTSSLSIGTISTTPEPSAISGLLIAGLLMKRSPRRQVTV